MVDSDQTYGTVAEDNFALSMLHITILVMPKTFAQLAQPKSAKRPSIMLAGRIAILQSAIAALSAVSVA